MDRRGFLKSLAALGASIPAAALAGRPTRATLDEAMAGLAGTPWWVPVLRAWKDGTSSPALEAFCDALQVPDETECGRVDVAVARLLLGGIQHTLPAWRAMREGGLVEARTVFPSRLDGTPVFEPVPVATIDWADAAPGFQWPEAYHATAVPELGIRVLTASRDSDELMGCTDHALAWRPLRVPAREAALAVLRRTWRLQRDLYEQAPWEDVRATGLLDEPALLALRVAVWRRAGAADRDDDAPESDRG